MQGTIREKRRPYDSDVITPGRRGTDEHGNLVSVIEGLTLHRWSRFTRAMDLIFGRLWTWGKTARIEVVREDRGKER